VLEELVPHWRALRIHESSPAGRGISLKMKKECGGYVASQYFPDHPLGETVRAFRNEDLEHQTFEDATFDIVVTLDVMEHVFHPWLVYQEVCRTLRPGGYYIHTFPIQNGRSIAYKARAEIGVDGQIVHHEKPEFHGNPINKDGSLVTIDYGYDIHKAIQEWAPLFDVRLIRFCDARHGILGEFTDTVICKKREVRP
jgi:SAM-dependent methyltransferase